MLHVPVIRRVDHEECVKCDKKKAGVYVESTWRRVEGSFAVRQFYCWAHFRALAEGIEAVNAFTESAEWPVSQQIQDAKSDAADNLKRAKAAAEVAVNACGLDQYLARRIPLIRSLRVAYGLGVVEAKAVVEEAHERMKSAGQLVAADGHQPAVS